MGYYITVLTRHLTVSEQFNSFLSAFLPMAMESVVLSDALLALASGHLSLINNSYKVTALEARSIAIRNLAMAIGTPSSLTTWHEITAAACLIFVVSEVGTGDCKGWYSHLKGAKNIIMSASVCSSSGKTLRGPEAFKTSSEGQWVLRNFAYHDIIGSVTLRKRPLLDSSYLDGITDVVDSYLGVATELLCFLATISSLDEDTKLNENMSSHEARSRDALFHSTSATLEKRLQDWHCNPDAPADLAAVAYAFQSAALIVFYRLVRSRLNLGDHTSLRTLYSNSRLVGIVQSKIRDHVSKIMSHVTSIPIGTAPESALLFPLFMAGGEAEEVCHVDLIRKRLQMTLEQRQFQNVSRALEILERLWDLRQRKDGANADWSHILDASGGYLLLT
ncbi:fungal-specific transcription factor domain-containing protein [Dactylonectria estremocensis]|uniref:Fungal-specific transcription factor domain-containing protein n=1 Tax=Dactylonectria estremocensis TaxID=1079267 RepID=A0A9P9JFD3_9HYPO|nr:fungal-specific transcription factor domain-containing protein [Dactylonectria estremocensis]